MENYLKFLKRLPKNLRLKVIQVVELIAQNKLKDLDIKALSSHHHLYRCRVGKIRVLFQERDGQNYILDIGFRGEIYKRI